MIRNMKYMYRSVQKGRYKISRECAKKKCTKSAVCYVWEQYCKCAVLLNILITCGLLPMAVHTAMLISVQQRFCLSYIT